MTFFTTTRSNDPKPTVDIADRLGFAATPAFALMALVSAFSSQGMTMCSVTSPLMPINEMALMYLLMSFFHLSPWLKLISHRCAPITQTEGD